mmetsp:Transcript_167945/g.322489  ORF Transcript_167945/g.322489 Transcript_167945/m.322489 type:complete len:195 (+) Transcript_167945:2-586(+)
MSELRRPSFFDFAVAVAWAALLFDLCWVQGNLRDWLRKFHLYATCGAFLLCFTLIVAAVRITLQPEQFTIVDNIIQHIEPEELPRQNSVITLRTQQLNERSQVCTRRIWEEVHVPELLHRHKAPLPPTDSCCICLSGIDMDAQIRGLACGHIFHLPCLADCFMRDKTFDLCCPLCRVPISQQRPINADIDGKLS